MNNSVYSINKGINRPIEFKGLKAQYIGYMCAGLVILLLAFAIMYIAGVPVFACLALVFLSGTFWVCRIYRLNHKYGQYGLMKKAARKGIPLCIKSYSLQALKNQLKKAVKKAVKDE